MISDAENREVNLTGLAIQKIIITNGTKETNYTKNTE